MRTVLIVPGLHGSPEGHWQTVLQDHMPFAYRVEQDDWNAPVLDRWMEQLVASAEANPGAIAIAHSLGCVLVAHAAHRCPGIKIGAALLVAPADVDTDNCLCPELQNFAPMPTKPLPFPSTVVGSCNDPYMALHRVESLAQAWGSEFVNLGAAGHINIASGYGWWPDAPNLVSGLTDKIPKTERQDRERGVLV